ncbi:MAG: TonB-system energizer ExbB [Campylobacterales bacterium]|nr:TonB-system energizer ExbB [Campylobacterales bacterium]
MDMLKEIVDYGVLGTLFFMSFLVLTYSVERVLFYKKISLDNYKTKNEIEIALTSNLSTISMIGSNAPYVGLLGTVIGIMVVFYDMGQNSSLETATVVIGLSLALKATALGLLVAIPSMMIYGAFLRKTDILMGRWEDALNQKI